MVDIIRTSTVGASQDGINQIIKQQHNLQYTNLQVAKGKRIVTTADDPVGAAQSLSLRQFQEMTQNNQKILRWLPINWKLKKPLCEMPTKTY